MNQTPTPKKQQKPIDGEALTAIFLLALTVFLIATVSIVVFRSCDSDQTSPNDGATTPPAQTTPAPEPAKKPVFSSGVLPSKPFYSDTSATVSFSTTSQYIVLTNANTGEVIASLNPKTRFSPASMTKVPKSLLN